MKTMYGALLPYVKHRADLNYLLDNMGAEIAVGHSYVRGGDLPDVPQSPGGLLGADFTVDNGRYKITRIYDTESWNPELRAPLASPGVDVSVGDYILAINGIELKAPDNIFRLLDGTANRQTVIAVNNKPVLEGSRQVTVVPVATEQALRTRAWVESNRRTVDKLSKGQLAYVYVPSTGQPGFTSFNRYYFAQQDRKGAIIDERFNGGGSAADYIIEALGRDFDGYFNNVAGDRMPFTSPSAGIWGPKVMIINEMAGSGGDLMPYMFKRRKIGPLVGKRTWGGLVHTADTPPFLDGGSMIAPRGGFITRDGKWAIENEGVGPDIDVENWPKDVIAGRDPQLERAVEEAMKLLKANPYDRMTTEPPPPNWGKRKGGGNRSDLIMKLNAFTAASFAALMLMTVAVPNAQQAPTPPAAKKITKETKIHGYTLKDDYFWLRDKTNAEVTKHLEAENAYTESVMAPHKALQETLYKEMLGRIKQTDLSVPARQGDYWYYSRTEEGKQYPYMCRRKGTMEAPEELLLDLNKMAEGHSFLGLGSYAVSDDANWLAFSLDTTGYRQYTLHVKDLRSGTLSKEKIERVGSVAWANDNKTLFFTTEDATTKRSDKFWRHVVGADDNTLMYEEKDELFDLFAGRSLDKKVIFVGAYAKTSARAPLAGSRQPNRDPQGGRAAAARARVRRRSLQGAVLHHDQQGSEELQGRDRADERSVGEELERFHRAQHRREDRWPLVLQRSPRRLGA